MGADPLTGDGAGILIQVPHELFQSQCEQIGISLPAEGKYGTGLVFLPKDERGQQLMEIFEQVTAREGLEMLGWRKVPCGQHPNRRNLPAGGAGYPPDFHWSR